VKVPVQVENITKDIFNIILFIIGRYNDEFLQKKNILCW